MGNDFWDTEESNINMVATYDEKGALYLKESCPDGWNWEKERKLLSWQETGTVLSNYKNSEHCFEGGEKQIDFKLRLICCVDNNGGNYNSDTGYWFDGNDGFFFEDANGNVYSTNSKGFYNEENGGEQIEVPHYHMWSYDNPPFTCDISFPYQKGMIFSFTANIADKEKVHREKEGCNYTRFHTVKNGKLLNPKNDKDFSFDGKKRSVQDYFNDMTHMSEAQKREKIEASKRIERGSAGNRVKAKFNHRCQICKVEKKSAETHTFVKADGQNYVEAHHVLQLSDGGPDTTENIMCLCANHHRQMHYGNVKISISRNNFYVTIDEKVEKTIPRWRT